MWRLTLKGVTLCCSLLVVSGCGGDDVGGGGGGNSAAANVTLTFVSATSSSGIPCTAHLAWTLEPIQLTGEGGNSDPLSDERDYSVISSTNPDGGPNEPRFVCTFSSSFFNLRSGRWRATLLSAAGRRSCEGELRAVLVGNTMRLKQWTPACEVLP